MQGNTTRFNNGKKGPGRANSPFRIAKNIWEKAGEIYFNGSHSDYQALSIYFRPDDRNNQTMEGGHNGSITLGESDAYFSSQGSLLRWINTAKKEEVGFSNRMYQINVLKSGPKLKQKKSSISKDKAIKTIVQQHAQGLISTRELLTKYIEKTSDHCLSRSLRHIDYLIQ